MSSHQQIAEELIAIYEQALFQALTHPDHGFAVKKALLTQEKATKHLQAEGFSENEIQQMEPNDRVRYAVAMSIAKETLKGESPEALALVEDRLYQVTSEVVETVKQSSMSTPSIY